MVRLRRQPGNGRRGGPRGARPGGFLVLFAVAAALASAPGPAAGQTPSPDDAFADAAALGIILRAREARERDIEGMTSYEGTLRERIYVGLTAARFRRERGLFERERIARLRWEAGGERAIQWLGARQAVPIIGADTRRDEIRARGRVGEAGAEVRDELRRELPDELLREVELPAFAFDPAGDRLTFGDDWALHPLADTATAHYRYAAGDTLRIQLPTGREVVLHEVKVEPVRADFHLVAGSLWFDAESGSLVRATYRPARAFNLLLDEPEDAEDVPGFLQPVEAEIEYITVEYSLHEFRFWLPRRFALEGEARLGRLVTIPLTVEWSLGSYTVNEPTTDIPVAGPLPPGWSRREERIETSDGGHAYVTVVVPESNALLTHPELSGDFGQRTPTAFTDQEVDQLKEELEALVPSYQPFRPRLAWGLSRGLTRFNRVEGLSTGVASTVPLTPLLSLDAELRYGTADGEFGGTVAVRHGPPEREWRLAGYRRLEGMGDWTNPLSITSSLQSLGLGSGRGQFYRATGVSLGRTLVGDRVRVTVEGFHERHDSVTLGTDFSLLGLLRDDTVNTVLAADAGASSGVRGRLGWFAGVDPNALILTGEVIAEAAGGFASYRRAAAVASASHPLPGDLAGAVEVGAGAVWGDVPLQRSFLLGGSATLRGFAEGEALGASFWRARGELASGFAGARLTLFSDVAWAGPRDAFAFDDPWVSVGVGASLLDGLLRFDVARGVRRGSAFGVHLYLDGLF